MRHALKGHPARPQGDPNEGCGGSPVRGRVAGRHAARIALGLATPAALVAASAAPALAAPGATAGATAGAATSTACTDTWVGKATVPQWTNAKNWSNGVPVAASDVCIGTGVDVLTGVSITVHSIRLGPDAGIALEGTTANPLTATVATSIDLTGRVSRIDMTDATIKAAQLSDPGGGTIFTDGTCHLTSPDISIGKGGSVQAANGTTTLASLSQLNNGTLTGASFNTSDATVVLPGGITRLVSSNVSVGGNSAIDDAQGQAALTGLTSIDSQSSLSLNSDLSLTGSFTASGNVSVSGATLAVPGLFTQAQGNLSLSGATLNGTQATIGQGAALQAGQSIIVGNLVNDGSAAVTGGAASQVTGSYTQAPAANLAAGFTGLPGVQATLAVTGRATLAGTLSSRDFLPARGATAPAITFAALSGGFTGVSLGFSQVTKAHEIDVVVQPQIAASPTTVAPGQKANVTGLSFGFGTTVRVFLDHTGGTPLASTVAGYLGSIAATVKIPAATAAGHHMLIAVGSDGSRASVPITVS